MRFLLDHNVLRTVQRCLEEHGHDVAWSRDVVGQDAPDQLVATTAMAQDRILVSHDNDMRRIQKFISERDCARYPQLSRLMLQCEQARTVDRLRAFMTLIQHEFELAQMSRSPLLIYIQKSRLVICR